jgi:hypothetical protein
VREGDDDKPTVMRGGIESVDSVDWPSYEKDEEGMRRRRGESRYLLEGVEVEEDETKKEMER